MKKIYFSTIRSLAAAAMFSFVLGGQTLSAQNVGELKEAEYTIPSWTKLKAALNQLTSAKQPYSINMTLNGDPKTNMGFAWFTNQTAAAGKVQLVAKADATEEDFANPGLVLEATAEDVTLNYLNESKNAAVIEETGIAANTKRSYTSHKALANTLTPHTTYSFRVGEEGAWSEIGQFTTAKDSKEEFSFIYITDTQANTAEMFDISQKTVHAAQKVVPDAQFLLCNGDFVETSGSSNSEWEWEQWFSTMQDVWLNKPIVAVQGNHDTSSNGNFSKHFHTDNSYNQRPKAIKTVMEGTVYSFVYGDALFVVINYEDWKTEGYFASLADWMREQVAAHPEVKWRIATYHKNMFTGSRSHQSDADGKAVREAMLPVFDELKIDVALQGHDHIYEVLGPVKNATKTLVSEGVQHVEIVGEAGVRENMTGKQGGVFNVNEGTLYFLNNSAGKKKYEPRNEQQMTDALPDHGVENYWGLFSGKFGQTGEATFSKVVLSTDTIVIETYTVDANGKESLFDSFKVIKEKGNSVQNEKKADVKIYVDEANRRIIVEGVEGIQMNVYASNGKLVASAKANSIDASSLEEGMYIVKAATLRDAFYSKVMIRR